MNLDRVDIESVLHRLGIEAKKRGREWEALCPNPEHADKAPSWRIRDEPGATRHGFHHCWPCSFGGSVVDLVMKVKGFEDYRDAKSWIEGGSTGEQHEVQAVEIRVRPPAIRFRLPDEVVVAPVDKWPSPARKYLESRGIEAWQAERWGTGYAVDGRLKGRVVFVVRDAKGRPRSYTARLFAGDGRRFLEPEENERADAFAVFGEQHWPPVAQRTDAPVFVVEGAIKALAIEAALPGAYVAATRGSEARPLLMTKLATFGRQCLIGDDDAAGAKVAGSMGLELSRHSHPDRLVLPRGLDADEVPRKELADTLLEWLARRRG